MSETSKKNVGLAVLDGSSIEIRPGETIYELAERSGTAIPTLCHDPRISPAPHCWVCVVEVEDRGAMRVHPSCSTEALPGMVIHTSSEALRQTRRSALELLMSDHYADCLGSCVLGCPANVDIPRYLDSVARGEYAEAVSVIRETNPFPGVCGRICPHPCEVDCKRMELDQPMAIRQLKRLATDQSDGHDDLPKPAESTGKRVAVVGAGPAGLTAAYFLQLSGHQVTVYDARDEAGGMLRYGVPEYRLPSSVLDADIDAIRAMGVAFRMGQRLGRDLSVETLRSGEGSDAVFVALGAWKSRYLGIPNEHVDRVWGGVEFLRRVSEGELSRLGGRIAVIGGGNSAIDAARTALRLGAAAVTIYYRRGREQMPAFPHEVEAALEEGAKLECLVAPTAVEAADGRVTGLRLQRMELVASEDGGRPRPVPIPDSEFGCDADVVISAVGESADWDAAAGAGEKQNVDPSTLATQSPGVFAGGDFVSGPSTAVEAIAAGRRAATAINGYLFTGVASHPRDPVYSQKRKLLPPQDADFVRVMERERPLPQERSVHLRILDFSEVETGIKEEEGREEAGHCLRCSCSAFSQCDLRQLLDEYQVETARFGGAVHSFEPAKLRDGLHLDMNKCIQCSRCVRICRELPGVDALSLALRGFETRILFALLEGSAQASQCDRCLQSDAYCVDTCPTGALTLVGGS